MEGEGEDMKQETDSRSANHQKKRPKVQADEEEPDKKVWSCVYEMALIRLMFIEFCSTTLVCGLYL